MKKSSFKIIKVDGVYNIYFHNQPLVKGGFPTREAAQTRLNKYLKNVKGQPT